MVDLPVVNFGNFGSLGIFVKRCPRFYPKTLKCLIAPLVLLSVVDMRVPVSP